MENPIEINKLGVPRDLGHLHMLDILIGNFHGVGFSSICWTSPETSSHVIGAYLSAHVTLYAYGHA